MPGGSEWIGQARVELFEQLRQEQFGVGTIAGVAAKFGVHRRMVRQALAGALPPVHRYPARVKPKLAAVAAFIDQVLDEDRRAPRAACIYRRILTEFPDAAVAESTVRNHVRNRRRALGLIQPRRSCRLCAGPPEAQVDWYEAWADLGGEACVFAMRSMASGAAFHRAYLHATQQAFLEAHEHAFAYFGGVFRLLRYGPALCARSYGATAGGDGPVRGVPLALALHGGVLHAGRGSRERRRGGRGRLFPPQPPRPGARAGRPRRAERSSADRMPRGRGADPGRAHGAVGAAMVAERDHLLGRVPEGFDLADVFPLVDKQGCAMVKTNAYSVPVRAGSRVEARAYPLHIELWHSGRRVARHERCHAASTCWTWSIISTC